MCDAPKPNHYPGPDGHITELHRVHEKVDFSSSADYGRSLTRYLLHGTGKQDRKISGKMGDIGIK